MRIMIAGAALALAGCSEASPEPATAPSPTPSAAAASVPTPTPSARPTVTLAAISLDGDGITLVDPESGGSRPIPFGTAESDVLAAFALRGTPKRSTNAECGAGPLAFADYPEGITLAFQEGKFAGWSTDTRSGGRITNMAGVGPGARRADIEKAMVLEMVPDSTLGAEFTTGGMSGILDGTGPNAKVSDMWAGATCIAR